MTHIQYWIVSSLVLLMEEPRAILAEDMLKYVCSGDSIPLFENITVDSIEVVVSLHIKASTERLIAMWTQGNFTTSSGYSRKVFPDKSGDIWIRNVSSSDEAQYTLKHGKGRSVVNKMVHLRVLDAPKINCKPKIQRVEDVLVASLEANDCGNPTVSVDWLNYIGNNSEGKDSVRLPIKNNAGTYYACISGPALRCAKTSKLSDYCTAFPVEDTHDSQDSKNQTQQNEQDNGLTENRLRVNPEPCIECSPAKYVLGMLIVIFVVLFLSILGFVIWKCRIVHIYYNREGTNLDKKGETTLTNPTPDCTSKSDSGKRASQPSLEELAVFIKQESEW